MSDPNRQDDPQYIPRLVAKVVTVSVETGRLVPELERAVSLAEGAEATLAAVGQDANRQS